MPSDPPSVLAVDLGGASLRAALVGQDGILRHRHAIVDQIGLDTDPARWWQLLQRAAEGVAHRAGEAFDAAMAVCLTGMTRTQVVLDRDGASLRPAMAFHDTRAAALVAALPPLAHPEAGSLSAYHPAARLLWLARHEPAVLNAAATVVDPKDWLASCLTGRVCTDPLSGARLAAAAQPAGASLLDMLGLPNHLTPPMLDPGVVIGPVRGGLDGVLARLVGRPVAMAAHDTWASVLGMGALRDGAAYNLSGTTEVLGVLTRMSARAPGLISAEWGAELHHLGGPSNAGGATLAWATALLAPQEAVGPALDRLLALPRERQPALFLPYCDGERTRYWDPALRGAFVGLSHRHGPTDLAWAVLEGIAYLNRIVLDRAEAASGRAAEFRFGGGGAASAAWCQVKADILARPVMTMAEPEAGLLGAGIAGWMALGAVPSLAAGQAAMVRTARVFDQTPDRRAFYDRLFRAYCAADGALAPVSRMLAGEE